MQPPAEALASHEATIDIAASPAVLYDMVADIGRMGEWSPEAVGGRWLRGGSGHVGDWFEGDNQTPEREWSRECEVAVAEPGVEFTFVVGGVEANCTWWSYEFAGQDGQTTVTERWWMVNKTPAMAAATPEQVAGRIAMTEGMLHTTLANLKQAAESA